MIQPSSPPTSGSLPNDGSVVSRYSATSVSKRTASRLGRRRAGSAIDASLAVGRSPLPQPSQLTAGKQSSGHLHEYFMHPVALYAILQPAKRGGFMRVPPAAIYVPEEDRKWILEQIDACLQSGQLTLGKNGKQLEEEFAALCG